MHETHPLTLFGSLTSPYVRRLRIWLAVSNIDYNFVNLNIFDTSDRETLSRLNPTLKIPMISFKDDIIYDSSAIQRYLTEIFALPPLTWQQQNQLTMINSANDSLVELLLCQRSGFDTDDNVMFFNLQRQRVEQVLEVLNNECTKVMYQDFNYLSISLFCLIDWTLFRNLCPLDKYANLVQLHQKYAHAPVCQQTTPRD